MEKHASMEREASMGHHSKSEEQVVGVQVLREQTLKLWNAQAWDAHMSRTRYACKYACVCKQGPWAMCYVHNPLGHPPHKASQQGGAPLKQEKNAASSLSLTFWMGQLSSLSSWALGTHTLSSMWLHLDKSGMHLFREPLRLMCKLRSL